eukprot:TRINITY_DN78386_c0_g1_i1.p1 TRINITY_DN78386_c0_g1~~TRINITY_DN78386_c0_g1_i1.p1  ORF type:complete len:117 (-),score=16.09 TRINITY_DN78386_c0_g1_i1:262-612(-)
MHVDKSTIDFKLFKVLPQLFSNAFVAIRLVVRNKLRKAASPIAIRAGDLSIVAFIFVFLQLIVTHIFLAAILAVCTLENERRCDPLKRQITRQSQRNPALWTLLWCWQLQSARLTD